MTAAIVEGLKKIDERLAKEEAKYKKSDGPQIDWFSLKDGESAKFVFLQELDFDSPNYSTTNGLGLLVTEHYHPDNFRTHALCTHEDDTPCYGCEQNRLYPKTGWAPKQKLYITVGVETEDGIKPMVMSQSVNPKATVGPAILERARELETLTDVWYRIKRTGAGQYDTSYTFTSLKDHGLNVEDYPVWNLRQDVLRNIPYDEQEDYYNRWREFSKEEKSGLAEFAKKETKTADDTW